MCWRGTCEGHQTQGFARGAEVCGWPNPCVSQLRAERETGQGRVVTAHAQVSSPKCGRALLLPFLLVLLLLAFAGRGSELSFFFLFLLFLKLHFSFLLEKAKP